MARRPRCLLPAAWQAAVHHRGDVLFMKRYNWEFDFDPEFPIHLFEYTVVGARDAMHWHRYFEIGLCLEGDGQFAYLHKKYPVHPGDIFINNDYENHVAITDEGCTNRYLFLILMPSFISDSASHRANRRYIETFQYNPPDFINRIPCGTPTAEKITSLITHGLKVYQTRQENWEMELDIIVRNILLALSQHYLRKDSEESARQNINPKILAAQRYIHQNYNQPLTLDAVAAYVGFNTTYFRHLFKKEMRISFKEYLTHLRVNNARMLLLNSSLSIGSIIEEVGYSNISQFYRIFRQGTGLRTFYWTKWQFPFYV